MKNRLHLWLSRWRSAWSTDYGGSWHKNEAAYGVWKEGRFFDA